jgi:hypothetical protein
MFCPSCGSEERQATQFCRACGTDLRAVRTSLERPDSITASAVSAREEIGRAVAQKIREVEDARELKKVADHVLPQIAKFLESPEEKRLRRMRAGVVTAAAGLGTTIAGLVLASVIYCSVGQTLTVGAASLGLLMFLVGLGLVINAIRFTAPRKAIEDNSSDALAQSLLDEGYSAPQIRNDSQSSIRVQTTSNLAQPGSVTDHTTLHLKSDR